MQVWQVPLPECWLCARHFTQIILVYLVFTTNLWKYYHYTHFSYGKLRLTEVREHYQCHEGECQRQDSDLGLLTTEPCLFPWVHCLTKQGGLALCLSQIYTNQNSGINVLPPPWTPLTHTSLYKDHLRWSHKQGLRNPKDLNLNLTSAINSSFFQQGHHPAQPGTHSTGRGWRHLWQ
jgi:hypothetical protein